MFSESDGAGRDRLVVVTLAALFIALLSIRLAYLLVREPFFDELFTLWISRQPLPRLFAAIALDSGPPLYYLLTAAASRLVDHIVALRFISLVAGSLAAFAIIAARLPVMTRAAALLLLTVAPLHVHFSTEARAYALCATALGFATVALHGWRMSGSARALLLGAVALLAAAYTHYYGVLAFPLLLLAAVVPGGGGEWRLPPRGARIRAALIATLAVGVAYVPGFMLAAAQPRAATAWMSDVPFPLLSAVRQLAFAAPYPSALMTDPPQILQMLAVALFLTVVLAGVRNRATWWWGVATLAPALAATVLVMFGARAYFPARFESVLIVPLVIWLAVAIQTFRAGTRRAALLLLAAVAVTTLSLATLSHLRADRGAFRQIAAVAAGVAPEAPIVVSGLSYLELVAARGGEAGVIALPAEQALHPGWRATVSRQRLQHEVAALAQQHERIFWLGERGSPEQRAIFSRFRFSVLHREGPLLLAYGVRR